MYSNIVKTLIMPGSLSYIFNDNWMGSKLTTRNSQRKSTKTVKNVYNDKENMNRQKR